MFFSFAGAPPNVSPSDSELLMTQMDMSTPFVDPIDVMLVASMRYCTLQLVFRVVFPPLSATGDGSVKPS